MNISLRRIPKEATKGFTIVEMIVGLSMTVLLLMVIMNFMANYFRQYTINMTRAALLADSQRTLDEIGEDVRLSASADANNRWQDAHAPDSDDAFSWESSGDTLILATAVESDEGNIIFADAAQYISEKDNNIYFVDNGNLYRRTLASPVDGNKSRTTCPKNAQDDDCPADRLLAENVDTFSIRYLSGFEEEVASVDARAVELHIVLSDDKFGQEVRAEYTARMVFRNG